MERGAKRRVQRALEARGNPNMANKDQGQSGHQQRRPAQEGPAPAGPRWSEDRSRTSRPIASRAAGSKAVSPTRTAREKRNTSRVVVSRAGMLTATSSGSFTACDFERAATLAALLFFLGKQRIMCANHSVSKKAERPRGNCRRGRRSYVLDKLSDRRRECPALPSGEGSRRRRALAVLVEILGRLVAELVLLLLDDQLVGALRGAGVNVRLDEPLY